MRTSRLYLAIAVCAGLAACGGGTGNNPINGGGGDGETTQNDIPEELARNLQRINYNADTDTLIVEISSLDSGDGEATYDRNPALDVPGYSAFTLQDDPLDRMFIALVAASTDGSVQAGVVADGGQFNRYFSGGFYERTGPYSQPTTGQVSYAGAYAGITNLPAAGDNLLDPPPGTDPSLLPREPRITVGTAFNPLPLVLGVVTASAMYCLAAFPAVVRYDSINEMMFPAMIWVSVFSLPILHYAGLFESALMYLHPFQAPLVLLEGTVGPLATWEWVYGLGYSVLWIGAAYVWCRRAFARFVVAAAGTRAS